MLHPAPSPHYTPSMDSPVHHDPERGTFTAGVDGAEGVLEYARSGPTTVEFTHTFVPPALRGRGIAERLVIAGLSWAREQGLRVIPSCPYVAAWLGRHPEWDDLRPGRAAS
jgi:predicted GNAT family acetyltransferase